MAVITKIVEQKRRPNRRNVFLDDVFAFGCNLNVIARFRLREGMHLSHEQVLAILNGEVRQECFDKAMRFIQLRLHSRAELAKKLARNEYGERLINDVLDQLTELGYINDAQFAKARATSAAKFKHHGQRRAKLELARAGIRGAVADKALAEVYNKDDSFAVARMLAEKQAPRLKKLDPQVARRRLTGMLQRRGFEYEAIKPVIDQVLGAGRESDVED